VYLNFGCTSDTKRVLRVKRSLNSIDNLFTNPSIAKAFPTVTLICLENDYLAAVHQNPQISDIVNTIKDNTPSTCKRIPQVDFVSKMWLTYTYQHSASMSSLHTSQPACSDHSILNQSWKPRTGRSSFMSSVAPNGCPVEHPKYLSKHSLSF
jgi:hypothetical protein